MNTFHSRAHTFRRAAGICALVLSLATISVPLISSTAGAAPTTVGINTSEVYGYTAADSLGDVYITYYSRTAGAVYKVLPDGSESFFASVDSAWALAIGPNNDVYVSDFDTGTIYVYSPSGALLPSLTLNGPVNMYAMAVDSAGNVFVSEDSYIYEVNSSGTSTFSTSYGGYGLAFDAEGNLYSGGDDGIYKFAAGSNTPTTLYFNSGGYYYNVAVDEGGNVFAIDYYGDIVEISSAGVVTQLGNTGYVDEYYYGLALSSTGSAWTGGEEYYYLYQITGIPFTSGGVVSNLSSTADSSSITATWTGSGTYTCTLVYGFGSPTTFTVNTTADKCTFSNLAPGSWGIAVSSTGGSLSTAKTSFATIYAPAPAPVPVKKTITCVRKKKTIHVTAISPKCPSGYTKKK